MSENPCGRSKNYTAYSHFKEALRSLRLNEFPCGAGSWRNPNDKGVNEHFMITGKDYGVNYEKVEQLLEYLKLEDWQSDTDWSKEAKQLKQMAVINPWKFENEIKCLKFVQNFIKSLQFRDKNINCVDENTLNFKNLEELVLTANDLLRVNSKHLPEKLQVLELSSNKLKSVSSLCKKPPRQLLHLGLSHNQLILTCEYKFFTDKYWPNLMSLDLSYNNLTQLKLLIPSLESLQRLKNLNLQGNPLSLASCYRGLIVDSLKNLIYLDDVIVSPDERHYFKGLAKLVMLKDVKEETRLKMQMKGMCGLPVPTELQEIEKPEFPVVETRYFVSYKMPKENNDIEIIESKQVSFMDDENEVELTNFNSDLQEWQPKVVDINYQKCHKTAGLLELRDFLMKGLEIEVCRQVINSYPEESSTESCQDDKKSARKTSPDKKSKGKKKPSLTMRSDPPEIHRICSYVLDVGSLLNGNVNELEKICYCGGGPAPTEDQQLRQLVSLNQTEEPKPEAKTKGKKGAKKPGSPGKTSKKSTSSPDDENSPEKVEAPILLDLKLTLTRWTSTSDCKD